MKRSIIPLLLLGLCSACSSHYDVTLRGTLYSDATQTTPLPADTLLFFESDSPCDFSREAGYVGYSVTDALGHWGFAYEHGVKNPYMQHEPKLSIVEYYLFVVHGDDTLYCTMPHSADSLHLYPGAWQNPCNYDSQGGEQ